MNRILTILLTGIAAASCALAIARDSQCRAVSVRLATTQATVATQSPILTSYAGTIDDLRKQLAESHTSLSNAIVGLTQAKELISNYQTRVAGMETAQSEQAKRQKLIDEVPAVQNGASFVFAVLPSRVKTILATNAEYVRVFGRRLTFKSGFDFQAFDVDDLHPGVLLRLGIDTAAAKDYQAKIDAAKRAGAASDAQKARSQFQNQAQFVAQESARRDREDAEQKRLAAEQAKDQQVAAQQARDEWYRQQSLANDTMRARAAMIQAIKY